MDRRLVVAVCAACLGLACGVLALALQLPVLGIPAGLGGVVAAIATAAVSARERVASSRIEELGADRHRLRREVDALAAIFAEEAARRGALDGHDQSEEPDVHAVFDASSGLLHEQFFGVLVQQRVAAARRQLQPVSILIFELDGLATAEPTVRDQALGALGDVVRRTLRECDTACRVGPSRAAAVLEDTAEAGAVWAAERVRGTLHSSPVGDSLTVSAGIACYPSHALSGTELMEMAEKALELARSRGRDHVEIAPAE